MQKKKRLENRINWLQRCTDVYTVRGLLSLENDPTMPPRPKERGITRREDDA